MNKFRREIKPFLLTFFKIKEYRKKVLKEIRVLINVVRALMICKFIEKRRKRKYLFNPTVILRRI